MSDKSVNQKSLNKIIERCQLDQKKISFWKTFDFWKDIALLASSFSYYSLPFTIVGYLRNYFWTPDNYESELAFDDHFMRKNESKIFTKFDAQPYNNSLCNYDKYLHERRSSNLWFYLACIINTLASKIIDDEFLVCMTRIAMFGLVCIQILVKFEDNYLRGRNACLEERVHYVSKITNE